MTQALAQTYAHAPTGPLVDRRPELTLHVGSDQPLGARRNRLLACLPEAVWQRWQVQLEAIDLPLGKVLCEPGGHLAHVVFPTTAVVSLQYLTENGSSTEIALIGNEGMVGTWLPMGGGTTQSRAVVISGGRGFRICASALLKEFDHSAPVMQLLLRYTQALMTQTSQMAACNRHHSLEQQLCRWLLQTLDRLASSNIVMTHELIANMMGVRREGVTEAAGRLQKAGLISYCRGHIAVLDPKGLEARSCECYLVVKDEYDRLLPRARTASCSRLQRHQSQYSPIRANASNRRS